MHLNILLSLTLFALLIQANCSKRSDGFDSGGAVGRAAEKVREAIESNPNAYRPLTEKSLFIPYTDVVSGVELQLSNGTADGLSSFEGENKIYFGGLGNGVDLFLGFKFDNLSFTFDFESEDGNFLPFGVLQFIAYDIQFDCSVKVESSSPFVLGEFLISKETRVGKMELFIDKLSYKEYDFYYEFDFEEVLKDYAQKMSDYARETLSEYSYYLVEQLQEQLSILLINFDKDRTDGLPLYI